MNYITMDVTKCVVCRNCEYACAFRQSDDFDRDRACVPMQN